MVILRTSAIVVLYPTQSKRFTVNHVLEYGGLLEYAGVRWAVGESNAEIVLG